MVGAFFVIALLPLVYMFGTSFFVEGSFSFGNYVQVFTDYRQITLFFRSLYISLGASILSLVFGVLLAVIIVRTDIPGKSFFKLCYLFPLLIPSYIHSLAWIDILGVNGAVNNFLCGVFNLSSPPIAVYGTGGVIFVLFLSYFPFVTLLCAAGLESIDGRLEEASLLKYGWVKTIKSITFPVIFPYILSGVLFVFIFSICNYGVPDLLRVKTYPVEIFVKFSAFYNTGAAVATAVPLVFVALLIVYFQKKVMKGRSYVTIETGARRAGLIKLNKWKTPALFYVFVILALAVLLPLVDLILVTGDPSVFVKAVSSTWKQMFFTCIVAIISSLIMVFISFILSYYIERSSGKRKECIDIMTVLPFAIPATVLGIGLISVWNNEWSNFIYGSVMILIIGFSARFIPFTVRILQSTMKQVNRHVEEAAQLCAEGWFKSVRKILIPLTLPGILTAWYIGYVLCLGELGTTLLVIPPGKATLTLRMYSLMHYGATEMVSALSLMLIIMAILPFPVLMWVKKSCCEVRVARCGVKNE